MAPRHLRNILPNKKVYDISSDFVPTVGNISEITEVDNASFETAIAATKFGKFNIFLFLIAIPAAWTSSFETTTMSYVFPAAHCDLDLSLTDRGSLNAITFLGMISSGFVWGFFIDLLGRRKLLIIGYFLDALFVIMCSFSQNLTSLLIFKFFGGFIINGPFSALTAYMSEFHCAKYRSRVQLARGMIVSCGTMMLPLLGWAILPQPIKLNLFNNGAVLYSWNIFIMVTAVPSLISAIVFIFMPESPKFLMTVGRNEEALAVFQKVYSLNTGKSKEEFPIKKLEDETTSQDLESEKYGGRITAKRNKTQAMKEGFQQIKPLCFPPHLKNIILVCSMQAFLMLTVNTLRLWLPQIFQAISDYQYYHNGTTDSLCVMLKALTPSTTKNTTCHVNFSPSVYQNTIVIAAVAVFGYVIAGTLINKIGKKTLVGVLSIIIGLCAMGIYFSRKTVTVVTLSSLFIAMGGICVNVIVTIVIDLFPTSLRAIAISLVMTCGRLASVTGNLIFPILLAMGCAPPFFTIGTLVIGCSILTIFLPNTELKALR